MLTTPGELFGEYRQFEIMRRKERKPRAGSRARYTTHMPMRARRPSYVTRAAGPIFIEQNEARRCGVVQDVRGFGHLDHETSNVPPDKSSDAPNGA